MTSYARLSGEDVVEIVDLPDDVTPHDAFTAEIAATLLPCPAEVSEGWTLVDGTWVMPSLETPEPPDLYAHAADRRWQVETGGIMVGGVPVATDDRSKTMIMGARIKADADLAYVVGWKGADGGFVSLTAPQIIAISDAVLAHVDACFAAEAAVVAAIAGGTITTAQQVDDWSWPG